MNEIAPLTVSVDVHKGEVMLVFNRSILWWALPPEDARRIAKMMLDTADQIVKTSKGGTIQ